MPEEAPKLELKYLNNIFTFRGIIVNRNQFKEIAESILLHYVELLNSIVNK